VSLLSREARRLRALAPARRRLFFEALGWLCLLRIATLTLPFRRVAALLRLAVTDGSDAPCHSGASHGSDAPCHSGASQGGASQGGASQGGAGQGVEAVGWAIAATAARTPWLSSCLVQSLAGYLMLRRLGVPSDVYLGVGKNAAGEFTAHSWLRCGDRFVTGGGERRHAVIACYRAAAGTR
jgi:hypothetical protein